MAKFCQIWSHCLRVIQRERTNDDEGEEISSKILPEINYQKLTSKMSGRDRKISENATTTTASTASDDLSEPNHDAGNRDEVTLRRKPQPRPFADSSASEISVESLTSVNSILSDESSIKTYR